MNDWDGDGFKDLTVGSDADGTLDFFKGSQDGTLAQASTLDMSSARRRWIGTVMASRTSLWAWLVSLEAGPA